MNRLFWYLHFQVTVTEIKFNQVYLNIFKVSVALERNWVLHFWSRSSQKASTGTWKKRRCLGKVSVYLSRTNHSWKAWICVRERSGWILGNTSLPREVRHSNRLPRAVVTATILMQFKKHLGSVLSFSLGWSFVQSDIGWGDACESSLTQDFLRNYTSK